MASTIQRTFAAGEITPEMHARADQTKYQTGLRTCRNAIVQRFGGVTNRPGTKFVVEVKDSSKAVRLIKFVFSADQTYVLELGDLYMRVIRNGAQVLTSGVSAWSSLTAYVVGDLATLAGVTYYCILAHTNHTPANATYWYAQDGSVYEIPTPYLEADLADLQYVQAGDVVTLTHPSYAPRELARTGHTTWSLTTIVFGTLLDAPTAINATAGAAGSLIYRYQVTAVNSDGQETPPGEGNATALVITAIANTNTAITLAHHEYRAHVTTSAPHGLVTGDDILIDDVVGMTELNGKRFRITKTAASTFYLTGVDSRYYTAYVSGGTATATTDSVAAAVPTDTAPIVLTWTAASDANEYNVYREYGGVFGYIGTAKSNSFNDINYVPDTSVTPPVDKSYFQGASDFPSSTNYFQQRRLFASSNNEPESAWMSRVGDYSNFTASEFTVADDAFKFTAAGREVQRIQHFVDLGKLLMLTDSGEWIVDGDTDGVIKPFAVNLRQQGYIGADNLRPIIVGSTALFVQARGSAVYDMRYELSADGYTGNELTTFAAHLFDGYSVADWDYQKRPHSVVWMVRSDGELIGLTYVREQQIAGFHHHDTDGDDTFENVVSVPEDLEDAVYVVANRTVDGDTVRYIERFATRVVTDVAVDAIFVDSSLSYDGRNAGAVTLTLTGGTDWTYTETLILTASAATFDAEDGSTLTTFDTVDVGNEFVLRVDDDEVRVRVMARTDSTHITCQALSTVPAALRTVATSDWDKAVDTAAGLDHLEGRTVSALGDGNVTTDLVVASGSVTLPQPRAVIHVGLPIVSDIETLDLETLTAETLSDKQKRVNGVTIRVRDTRGLKVGDSEESTLRSARQPGVPATSIPLYSGPISVVPVATWNTHGRVFIRQTDPLPFTILSITPSGVIGG